MTSDASRLLALSAGPLDAFMAAQAEQAERMTRMVSDMIGRAGLDRARAAAEEASRAFTALAEAAARPFRDLQTFLRRQAERVRALGAGLAAVARRRVHRVRRVPLRVIRSVARWWHRSRRRETIPLRPPVRLPVGVWTPPPSLPAPIARHGFTITPNGPPVRCLAMTTQRIGAYLHGRK